MYKASRTLEVRTRRRADYMLSRMDLGGDTRILEMGCGDGSLAHYLAGKTQARILATDLCAPFIATARARYSLPNLEFAVADLTSTTALAGQQFNYVVGNGILHHLYYQLDESLQKIHSLLLPGGGIVFLEPNPANPVAYALFHFRTLRKMTKLEPTEMTFTRKFITSKLETAGFTDICVEYRDLLLPFLPRFLIGPVTAAGKVIERIPLLNAFMAQSLFICARRRN